MQNRFGESRLWKRLNHDVLHYTSLQPSQIECCEPPDTTWLPYEACATLDEMYICARLPKPNNLQNP